ncbi:AtpZ/AtpI family protein [Paraburkholderia fungorum]|jgi:ATP synthase protein I|uniref:AtpZ/AtpI family protein n=1 Tax=Paraburkholderia fungorum TaxID=134537 RepID=UPI003877BFB4
MSGPPREARNQRGHDSHEDRLAGAAQQAAERAARGREEPEPSLGYRLGQIGILGWAIILPTLLGLALGHWLDRSFGTRVFFSAPLLMVGAAVGLWSAWKWMHRQQGGRHD